MRIWCYLLLRQLLFRHAPRFVEHMLDLMTLYEVQVHNENSKNAGPTKAITRPALNNSQARKLGTLLCRRVSLPFRRDDKDIGKQFWRQLQQAKCWSGSSYLYLWRQNSNCSSHIVTQFMDVLFGVIHTNNIYSKTCCQLQ